MSIKVKFPKTTSFRQNIINSKKRVKVLLATGEWIDTRHAKDQIVKRKFYLHQRGRCCFCREKMYLDCQSAGLKTIMATWEHVIPRSKGGKDGYHNRKLSCFQCNTIRGVMEFDTFLALRKLYDPAECKRIIAGDIGIARKAEKIHKKVDRRKLHQLATALDVLHGEQMHPHPYHPRKVRSNWQVTSQNYQTAMKHIDRLRPLLWQESMV